MEKEVTLEEIRTATDKVNKANNWLENSKSKKEDMLKQRDENMSKLKEKGFTTLEEANKFLLKSLIEANEHIEKVQELREGSTSA